MSDTTQTRRTVLTQLGSALTLGACGGFAIAGAGDRRTSQDRIKIGQIGVGHGHASKLAVYRASADYEVVGAVEPDVSLRQKAENAPAFRGVPWMTRDQLFAVPGLRAVLVETRVRNLLDQAEAAVSAGFHVHLDKPAGESLPQYKRILESAARKRLMVQMGYMYRYNPAVMLLREFLKNGWLGEIFEVHAVMSKVVEPAARRELAGYRGGMMFELGCHILDLVVGVLGKPEKVTSFLQHASALEDGLMDNTLAVLSYPRATATVKSTAMEVDGNDRRHLTVCGTSGTFHIQPLDNPGARITLSQPRGGFAKGAQDRRFPTFTRYVADAAEMAKVIRGEKAPDFSPVDDLLVQETLLRACQLPTDV